MSRPRLVRSHRAGVVLLIAAVALTACSGGAKHRASPSVPSSTQAGAAVRVTRLLTIGSTDVQRAGGRGVVNTATRHAVLAVAQQYVDRAVLAPLETGAIGRGYASLFVPGIRPAAIGPDVNALTDRVIGATSTLNEQSTPVALSALADQSGALLYLATRFNVQVKATRPSGPIAINRSVELTYERVGTTWLVAAYRIKVTRSAPAPAPATGAAPAKASAAAFRASDSP